jgi:hypothetical protein
VVSNFFSLPSQFECDRHDHLDGNRLIIQIRRFILPFLQRIQCSLVQERRSGHDLHVDNIPLPIQDCVNLYLTLNVCLPRQWRIIGTHLRDRLRRPYAPAYTHRHCFFRWWRGEGFRTGIQHSSHLPAGHSARHTTGYSAETIRLKWSFLDLRDLLGDCGWCDEFPASHEHALRCMRLHDCGSACGRRRGRGRRRNQQRGRKSLQYFQPSVGADLLNTNINRAGIRWYHDRPHGHGSGDTQRRSKRKELCGRQLILRRSYFDPCSRRHRITLPVSA